MSEESGMGVGKSVRSIKHLEKYEADPYEKQKTYIIELDDIGMPHFLQDGDLSINTF